MRYRIAYDEPGRLRVRFGPDAFTQEQGYGIAALLLGRPGVREAVTCALNGSVLVCYEGRAGREALAVLRGLRRDALPVGTAADDDQLRQVDSQFLGRLLSMAARHFLKKWFLPFPVRCAVTLWNAAGYWREGLRSLGGGAAGRGRAGCGLHRRSHRPAGVVHRRLGHVPAGPVRPTGGLHPQAHPDHPDPELGHPRGHRVAGGGGRLRGIHPHGPPGSGGSVSGALRRPDPGGRHCHRRRRHGE